MVTRCFGEMSRRTLLQLWRHNIPGKAWPTSEAEPAQWAIDKVDPNGNHQGAPGLFVDAEFGAYLDNLKLTAN